MRILSGILHALLFLAGAGIIAALAHTSIMTSGGYTSESAPLTVAIAVGIIAGAIAVALALSKRQYASALVVAFLAFGCEIWNAHGTAHRVMQVRDAQQAPLREVVAKRSSAQARITKAEAAVLSVPTSSARLDAALVAKARADQAAIEKAADKSCLANCKDLLTAAVTHAQSEADGARREIDAKRKASEAELAAARAAFDALPPEQEASALAAALGVPAWAESLVASVWGAAFVTMLAASLIAVGIPHHTPIVAHISPRAIREAPEPAPPLTELGQVAHFAKNFRKRKGATVAVVDSYSVYLAWCSSRGLLPLDPRAYAEAMGDEIEARGIAVRPRSDGREVDLLDVMLVMPVGTPRLPQKTAAA